MILLQLKPIMFSLQQIQQKRICCVEYVPANYLGISTSRDERNYKTPESSFLRLIYLENKT